MIVGKVVGTIVSTRKNEKLIGSKFMVIEPIEKLTTAGVLWYQGENNTATPEMAGEYRSTLQNLICDWRRNWRRPDLPFIVMQLANFGAQAPFEKDSTWRSFCSFFSSSFRK